MEMWKDIDDLPGYSISNKGRVMKNDTGKIMVLGKNNGYVRIVVAKHVHRLVAKAFLDEPENEEQLWVDHIDGNRSNNDVSNLRWVTPSENRLAFGHEQRSINKQRKVRATHLDGREIIFESRRACADYFGCSDSEVVYNKRYQRHSPKKRTNPKAQDKKGWMFEKVKVEDIV